MRDSSDIQSKIKAVKSQIETLSTAVVKEIQTLRKDIDSIPADVIANCTKLEAEIKKLES